MKQCTKCKENKERGDFDKNRSKPDGLQNICRSCKVKYNGKHYRSNKKRYALKAKKHRSKIAEYVKSYKISKGCKYCGYNKCNRALHFHHRNPRQKNFDINKGCVVGGFETVKLEIEKCDVVCANCHAEIHEGLIS